MATRATTSDSLSLSAAKKAVLGVKEARSSSASKAARPAKKASASSLKRYLGHFGVGSDAAVSRQVKKAAKKKTGAKRVSAAKKSTRGA
jgi:hypothetical protein